MAELNVKKWDDYYNPYKTAKKQTVSAGYDTQIQTVTDTYNTQIKDTESEYADKYRENAVQKLINEREVAENMANLGLTDSGLNRTQQTAVQLSYANNKANIDRQKQSMVDSLKLQLSADLSEIETNRANALMQIDDEYASLAAAAAQEEYNTTLKYETEIENARIAAAKEQQLLALQYGTAYGTKYAANGNIVYTDSNGNSVTMKQGANPYTNTVNKDIYDYEGKPTKVFSNGYQPNNVNGNKLSRYKPSKRNTQIPTKTLVAWRNDGVEQQVWTDGNKEYIWYGPGNRYVEARYNNVTGEWDVKI